MAGWGRRRWVAAVLGALGVAVLTGAPTVMFPNPLFGRMVPVTAWNRPVWVVTSVLAGLLIATYVTPATAQTAAEAADGRDELDDATRRGGLGGLVSYFAIGCPVCNKLVVLALGSSGAMSWFAPLQPLLAVASVGLLAWALWTRLRTAESCAVGSPGTWTDSTTSR